MEALAHRLRVAPQFLGASPGAKSIPAAGDHPSAHYPIAGSVTAVGQLTYFLLLSLILRTTGAQQLGHVLGSFPRSAVVLEFIYTAFEERSTERGRRYYLYLPLARVVQGLPPARGLRRRLSERPLEGPVKGEKGLGYPLPHLAPYRGS